MKRLRLLVAALAAAVLPTLAAAQTGTITGRVTSAQNAQPVATATVTVVGTALRAVTNENGQYRITGVPAGAHQVTASRLGFGTRTVGVTVAAGGTATADIALSTSAIQLGGLVATATGNEQRTRELGNSVSTLRADSVNLAPVNNVSQLIQGRAAGVEVLQSAGTTGTGARIRIRGNNSISLSNDPIIFVDGVRVNSNTQSSQVDLAGQNFSRLNDLNPEEIENIEVLKGPAASALYGTAAANGVIQITTKRGRAGKTRWNVWSELGSITEPNEYPINYRQLRQGVTALNGSTCRIYAQVGAVGPACTPGTLLSYNPLEQNSPFRDGSQRTVGLSIGGGTQDIQYFVSGESQRENGIYQNNKLDQVNLRGNVTAQVSRKLNLSLRTGYVSNRARLPYNDNAVEGFIGGGILGQACEVCFTGDERGGYFAYGKDLRYAFDNSQRVERFTGSMNARFSPLSWLTFNGVAGMDVLNRTEFQDLAPNIFQPQNGVADYVIGFRFVLPALIRNFTANGSGTATFDLTPSLASTTTAGFSFYRDVGTAWSAGGYNLLAGTNSLNAINERFSIGESNSDIRTVGLLASQQFAWRDKVYLTGSIRGDRNSAFGKDLGFIYYPSLSASWVVAEEPWFPQTSALSTLRLRTAYGQSGLTPGFRDATPFFNPITATVRTAAGEGNLGGFTVGGAGNLELKPERSREIEFGFDAGFLNDRFGLELTHYDKVSHDALVRRRLAQSEGSSQTQFVNLGKVSNKGWEALVNAHVLESRPLRWDATITYSTNSNKLLELGEGIEPIIFGIGGESQRHTEGRPLGSYFGVPYTFEDANHDGIIAPSEITPGDTAEFQGTPFPTREAGFNTTLTFFDVLRVSALIDHKGGYKLFNSTEEFRCGVILNCQAINDRTAPLDLQARAIADAFYGIYTGYIEDASFTKLREVSVTLMAPRSMYSRFGLGNLSLTLSGRNLHTWTNYTGLDPELNSGGQSNFSTFDFLG
ncbi:MAG TPA: SusC/RagA family TonB-linked outer membrane protein, partial [Longimicrobiaceae bacterium]